MRGARRGGAAPERGAPRRAPSGEGSPARRGPAGVMLRGGAVAPECTGRLSDVPGARGRREAGCGEGFRSCADRVLRGRRASGRGGPPPVWAAYTFGRPAPAAAVRAGRSWVGGVDGGERARCRTRAWPERGRAAARRRGGGAAPRAPLPRALLARATGGLPARGGQCDIRLILPVVICLS